jgi:hypothetical protein
MRLAKDPVFCFTIDNIYAHDLSYDDYAARGLEKAKNMFHPNSEDSMELTIVITGDYNIGEDYIPQHATVTVVYHIGMDTAHGAINGGKRCK